MNTLINYIREETRNFLLRSFLIFAITSMTGVVIYLTWVRIPIEHWDANAVMDVSMYFVAELLVLYALISGWHETSSSPKWVKKACSGFDT